MKKLRITKNHDQEERDCLNRFLEKIIFMPFVFKIKTNKLTLQFFESVFKRQTFLKRIKICSKFIFLS
jgi:hypothetical protein